MSKKENFKPKDFGKFHQKTRLEMVVRDCWNCGKKTVYVYIGDFGEYKREHTYECSKCGVHYISSKKIK